jgi:hypothetical protein
MNCIFDKSRPCGSKTRAKNRYTRTELEILAQSCGILNYKTKTMDELCLEIAKSKSPVKQLIKSPPTQVITKIKKSKPSCNFDYKRPCGSKAKGSNKYSRKELEKVAKECGIKGTTTKTMDKLCTEISNKLGVGLKIKSLKTKSPKIVKKPKSPKQDISCHDMIKIFKTKFQNELIGWMSNTDKPDYKIFVAGGYGIKTVLEDKYNIHGKVKTRDLDLTVSVKDSKMTPTQCFNFWVKKMNDFFAEYGKKNFKIKTVYLGQSWVPGFKYYRYYLINTSYKGDDFIDLAIGDIPITKTMMDIPLSKQVGLPIKSEVCYLKEFLTLVYMENVPGVSGHAYGKRNPVTGQYAQKGQKDIHNSKLMCDYVAKNDNNLSLSKKTKYKKYCKLLYDITIDDLKKMKKTERDKYFSMLSEIM